ncbi:MAG: ROK family protein, partial [Bifidobacteriales bacterium]|nr:ROK family protein [Bifidobacteriales bacterium]
MIDTAQAFGVDIGGSGIKAAPVDLTVGDFAEPRKKILTPEHSTPEAVGAVVKQLLDQFEVTDDIPVGVAFPAPVKPGQPLN